MPRVPCARAGTTLTFTAIEDIGHVELPHLHTVLSLSRFYDVLLGSTFSTAEKSRASTALSQPDVDLSGEYLAV